MELSVYAYITHLVSHSELTDQKLWVKLNTLIFLKLQMCYEVGTFIIEVEWWHNFHIWWCHQKSISGLPNTYRSCDHHLSRDITSASLNITSCLDHEIQVFSTKRICFRDTEKQAARRIKLRKGKSERKQPQNMLHYRHPLKSTSKLPERKFIRIPLICSFLPDSTGCLRIVVWRKVYQGHCLPVADRASTHGSALQ